MTTQTPIKLHGFPLSGHSHRVELALNLFGIPYEFRQVDLANGEHKKEPFLALNLFGTVPAIEHGTTVLADSAAILTYLADRFEKTDWYPTDPVARAEIHRWFSAAAGPLASGPAAARLITVFGAQFDPETTIAKSHDLLKVVETHLTGRDFFVGDSPSLADIAMYSYIAHAPEGNVDLSDYLNIRAWLRRVEGLPNFIPMPSTAVGLAA